MDKRRNALEQLGKYVNSDPKFVTGSLQIEDGEAKKSKAESER